MDIHSFDQILSPLIGMVVPGWRGSDLLRSHDSDTLYFHIYAKVTVPYKSLLHKESSRSVAEEVQKQLKEIFLNNAIVKQELEARDVLIADLRKQLEQVQGVRMEGAAE